MNSKTLLALSLILQTGFVLAAQPPAPPAASGSRATPDDLQLDIVGKFKGRFLVKKILAPVTMNLEKLQDFPEDPSQKLLLSGLPVAYGADFNYRSEVKGHTPFYPWIPSIAEPPFLRMVPPKIGPKDPQPQAWMFEVLNPQGQTIFRQRGTNSLPDELIWEGKDSEKKFAVVDRLYSAQLTLIGSDERAEVITGDSIVLPAMIYGSDESETIELALSRLFLQNRTDISPEGEVMIAKIGERMRERGLTKMFVRIAAAQKELAGAREKALVAALEKSLLLAPGLIEHDSVPPTLRGDIASFWIKKEAK